MLVLEGVVDDAVLLAGGGRRSGAGRRRCGELAGAGCGAALSGSADQRLEQGRKQVQPLGAAFTVVVALVRAP